MSGTVTANAGTGNFNAASDGATGSAMPTTATLVGAKDGSGLLQSLNVDAGGALKTTNGDPSVRTPIIIYVDAIAGVTTEALVTMNINKGGTVTTGTSYTVTAGKTLRVQSIEASVSDSAATATNIRVRLRSAATVAATSPIFTALVAGNPASVASTIGTSGQSYCDGLEFAAGVQVGLSQLATATTALLTISLVAYEY